MARDVVSAKLDIIFKKLFTENKDMLHSFVASMLDVPQESILPDKDNKSRTSARNSCG